MFLESSLGFVQCGERNQRFDIALHCTTHSFAHGCVRLLHQEWVHVEDVPSAHESLKLYVVQPLRNPFQLPLNCRAT